ncbi:MAG: hypothetical protein HYY37_04510 [Candidatus Aenigmarchaeota archaeon]|nr:hypothetical protein [Candidatus Aenigmarchaeota archaeon]
MYHPGKVIEIFNSKDKAIEAVDNSTQVMLEMWDDNLITVLVEPHLGDKVKKDDIVLVDYRPMANRPVPKMTVVKVLKGAVAKNMWGTYKDHHKKRNVQQSIPRMRQNQPYVG